MHRHRVHLSIVILMLGAAPLVYAATPAGHVEGTVRMLDTAHHYVYLDSGTELRFDDARTVAPVHAGVTARFTYDQTASGKLIESVEILPPGTLCGGVYRAGEGSNFAECPGAPEHFH